MSHEQLLLKIQALSQRERQLLLLGVLVIIYMLFSALVFSPVDAKKQQLEQQVEQLKTDTLVQTGLKKVYEDGIHTDPDQVKKRQIDGLKGRLEKLDDALAQLTVGLVPAKQLPQLLQDVLSRNGGLILSAVETLPISEMSLVGQPLAGSTQINNVSSTSTAGVGDSSTTNNVEATVDNTKSESAGVYKHSVRVSLEGAFFPVIEYLTALEGLPWRLFWQQLSYEVDDYPTARVEFVVYTLSTEEGLFSAH